MRHSSQSISSNPKGSFVPFPKVNHCSDSQYHLSILLILEFYKWNLMVCILSVWLLCVAQYYVCESLLFFIVM